jgi:hypothetical protein
MLALLLYVPAVDSYVCWREGVGLFKAFSGALVAGWGLLGLTSQWPRMLNDLPVLIQQKTFIQKQYQFSQEFPGSLRPSLE